MMPSVQALPEFLTWVGAAVALYMVIVLVGSAFPRLRQRMNTGVKRFRLLMVETEIACLTWLIKVVR